MRRFVTAGLLALVVALFTGCSDQDKESPTEPQFKKVSNECVGPLLTKLNDIHTEIDVVFNGRQAKRGAHQIVDNIGRKVCPVPPNYDATPAMAEGFYQHVLNEPVEEYVGGLPAAIALVERVFAFALGTPLSPIPPAAFEPDGGVGVVTPGVQDTIWTNNDEAAFVALPGSFLGDQPVTVVLTRLADPQSGSPGFPIPGFQAYPEAYDFSANAVLDGNAEVWMCVVLDSLPVPFENLVIGHNNDGTGELLTPPLYEVYDGQIIDCSNAGYTDGPPPPPVISSADTPAWLQLAGTILEPVVSRILDVKPLNAMYFAGKGLGGRTGSLSPFAPVDAGAPATFNFSCLTSGNGTVFGNGANTCSGDSGIDINTGSGFQSAGAALTPFPAGTSVTVTTTPGTGFVLTSIDGCDTGDGITTDCVIVMTGDRSVTATFGVADTNYSLFVDGTFPVGSAFGGSVLGYYTAPYDIPPGAPDFQCNFGDDVVGCLALSLAAGTTVRLTAVPDAGSAFDGWGLDCFTATGNDCWLWMLEDKSATANFSGGIATLTLTVPARVEVTDGASFTCDGGLSGSTCLYDYIVGETVTLDAVVWPETQAELWLGGSCSEGQKARTCTTVMPGDQVIELRFDIPV